MNFEDIEEELELEKVNGRLYCKPHWENLWITWSHSVRKYVYVIYDKKEHLYVYSRSASGDYSYSLATVKVLSDADLTYDKEIDSMKIVWQGRSGRFYENLSQADHDIRHQALTMEQLNRKRKKKKQEKKDMAKDVNFVGGDYYVVGVKYLDGTGLTYNFKVDIGKEAKEEDMVVVHSGNGYGLAKVVSVFPKESADKEVMAAYEKARAWVVDIVDMEMHQAKIDASERKKYILKRLEEKKEQAEEIAIYAALAKSDDEVAQLLGELQTLGKPKEIEK